MFRQLASAMTRAGASVRKRLGAALSESTHPFFGSSQADAKTSCYRGSRGGLHPPNHFLSISGRQFGILMDVHSVLISVCCCLLTPSLPI